MMSLPGLWAPVVILAAVGMSLAAGGTEVRAQDEDLPRNLDEMIGWGKEIYWGKPSCVTCHGVGGTGTKRGSDLSDGRWIHGNGTYEEIVELVTHGVPKGESETGREMPFGGWKNAATETEIRAVAAYVWSLSQRP
jgi:mono/diheme cytochrome c family protein